MERAILGWMRAGKQRWVAMGIAVSVSACSFPLVHGPKPAPAAVSDCTQSRLVPILDTVFTGVIAIAAISFLATSDAEWQKQQCDASDPMCSPAISQGGGALILAPFALLGAAGAYYGWTRTQACRDANQHSEAPPLAPIAPPAEPTPNATPQPIVAPAPTPVPTQPIDPMAPIGPAHGTPTGPSPTAVPSDPYGNKPTPAPTTGPSPNPQPSPKPVPKPSPTPVPKPKPTPAPKPAPKPTAGSIDAPPAPPVGIPLPGGP